MDHNTIWAKKDEKNGVFYWMPLTVHLEDTMNVSGWLWNHWLSDGQRQYLLCQIQESGENVNEEMAERLVRFLGAVHDIGKATPVFQIQKAYTASHDLDLLLLEKLEDAGFIGISRLVLASPSSTRHAFAGEVLLHEYGIRDDIASIIGAHHGKPISDKKLYREQRAYPANYYQSEDLSSPVAKKWQEVQKYFFQWALNESELKFEELPEISQPGQVILSGLLIMADWIASNVSYFPLFPITSDTDTVIYNSDQRFSEGMKRWFRNLPFTVEDPGSPDQLFEHRFGFLPRNFQTVIYKTVRNIEDPGIVVIEAPTGSGKTEAALAVAEQLAAKKGRSGIFFGLPTQATSNGIFGRILNWTESLAIDYGDAGIRLVHGKAALNPLMQALREESGKLSPEAENVDSDDTGGTVLINEWFSGRKTAALDDFVVGTVDQFLLMALKQKHLALRHLGFSKKVVVIDEVHAYDAYMQQYLQEALRWAGAYRVPVILLSATLPEKIRTDLIHAYMKGRGVRERELRNTQSALQSNVYPLISFSDGNAIRQNTDFETIKDRKITVRKLEEQKLFDLLSKFMEGEGVIGIIVNTVRRAQQIATECCVLFGRQNVELLHANFIASERIQKENRLMEMIGKNARRPERKIIIGTQVLEQSLDIDFDVLITDLCPVDLLIQRIGRLHRHRINRPAAFRNPVVYVMGESESWQFEKGSRQIYGDYLLARTQMSLPDAVCVPSDISRLVQTVYDETDNNIPVVNSKLCKQYTEFREQFFSRREKAKSKADAFRLDDPKLRIKPDKNNLIGWLQTSSEAENEEMACAQVRDTKETVEIIAVRQRGDGYSTFQSDADLSQTLDNPETDRMLAQQTLRLPARITAYGKINSVIAELEKYNRQYLPKWQDKPWLKGMLGIIFDSDNSFILNDMKLHYDSFLGLQVMGDKQV